LEFEWNDEKAKQNADNHGVSFPQAVTAFRDRFAAELFDVSRDYGEDRFVLIGFSGEQLLTVVYTERADRIRIISARRSTKYEEKLYESQNPR
jgi:uncharacterized protein